MSGVLELLGLHKQAIVEKVDGKWVLFTKDKSRRLGTHDTARQAYAQEYAIEKSQEREKAAGNLDTVGDSNGCVEDEACKCEGNCTCRQKKAGTLWWLQKQAMSREDLIAAGSCCGRKCHNCPYDPKHELGSTTLRKTDQPKSDSVLSTMGLESVTL